MTVSAEYRARNRTAVLRAAARLFRLHGYHGVNIDRIMAEAGLTRGTFPTYFPSKQALFRESIGFEPDFGRRLSERPGDDPGGEAADVVADYLDPAHRHLTWPGCVLASLSQDVARGDDAVRAELSAVVEGLVREFARDLDGEDVQTRALQAVAMTVGALSLAKAADGTELADQISEAAIEGVRDLLSGGDATTPRRRA